MIRLPVSSLLFATLGATLALTFACSGGDDTPGGTSGTGPSAGGTGNTPGTGGAGGSVSGSAGLPGSGGTAGVGTGGSTTGGTGGTPAAGGAGATGPTGGSAGSPTGGSAGSPAGGSAGMTGASGGAGPVGGTGGTGATGDCTITDKATQSEQIQTVFNVEVSTDLAGFDGGYIDFGVDTTYGYQAPIDMAAMNKKTMLLGMKQATDYHYRVVVKAGDKTCMGPDKTITTGSLLTGFPKATITTPGAKDKLTGGFFIAEFYAGMRKVPFIFDKDLDLVWTIDPTLASGSDGLSRARMSIDGKYMWVTRANVPNGQGALVKKIAMDGSSIEDLSSKFTRINHDFTIVDDEHQTMYFIAYAASGQCDDVVEYDPVTGMNRTVMNIGTAFASGACHCNAIQYSPNDDTIVVSELDHQAYVKVDRKTGAIKWVLGGGSDNDFTGDGSTWTKEHNMHMLDKDHMVFFNNGSGQGGSLAIELKLDETAKTATKMWSYNAMPNINNVIMGDVQRMSNGNTIVAYSTQGVVHEVDSAGTLLQSLSWGTGGAIGYIIKRASLYGKPPR